MAISPVLREDGSGGNQNPWSSDRDGVSISIGNAGTSGGQDVQILNSRIEFKLDTASTKGNAIGASSNFANGVVRAKVRSSHAGNNDNNYVGIILRATSASSATGIVCNLVSTGSSSWQLRILSNGSYVAGINTTFNANVDYELVLNAYDTQKVRCVKFTSGSFPPGLDYKSIAWDIDRSSGTDSFPTAAGKAGIQSSRFTTTQPLHAYDDLLAYASGNNVDVGSISLTAGDGKITVSWNEANAIQKRATAWYFLRYKANSEPINEDDGILITSNGSGLSGSSIRSDGRFLDNFGSYDLTGLTNGTTYYIRPFAVMWDGTIVAGTSQSATPSSSSGPPTPPIDFVANYPQPHEPQTVILTWTNPSVAGEYRINYRTDNQYPTSATDAAATIVQDWTAYSADSLDSKTIANLTNGTRYWFAIWHREGSNVNNGAFTQKVPVKLITLDSPPDGATGLQPNPFLVWNTSVGEAESNKPVHYKLEVSTSNTNFFENRIFVISSLDDGPNGFQYNASANIWEPLPPTGLPVSEIGKKVRYRFPINIVGNLYWRVSAQQPEEG